MEKASRVKKAETCPCHSGKSYQECCQPYHEGTSRPSDALALMRSRYAAYALKLPDYIINTSHPENTQFTQNRAAWKKKILDFCSLTRFEGLSILEFTENGPIAFVTFNAQLSQRGQDASYIERSRFEKIGGNWLYLNGEVSFSK